MKVFIYVEGPSDTAALTTLLAPLIESKRQNGIWIQFLPVTEGDHKTNLVTKVPVKAARILVNNPDMLIIVLPDLYPRNKGFPHQTFPELSHGVHTRFAAELDRMGCGGDQRITSRFKVFCLKHDLEALILAAEEPLKVRFGGAPLHVTWRKPVEDQNQDHPPKYVVEEIFRKQGQKYKDVVDAPLILRGAAYPQIVQRCPQCFKPFVDFLDDLCAG